MNLPQELTMTQRDLAGNYMSNTDCPLASALRGAGFPIGYKDGEGFTVTSYGRVSRWTKASRECAGQYVWDDGEEFNCDTLREGRLILSGSEPEGFQHADDPRR